MIHATLETIGVLGEPADRIVRVEDSSNYVDGEETAFEPMHMHVHLCSEDMQNP